MVRITEEELEEEIEKILKNANLSETTTKKVRQQLEKNFGMDLSSKKSIINELVMNIVNNKKEEENDDDDGDDDDDDEEEEEEDKKPPKRSAPAPKSSSKRSRKETSEEEEDDDESGSDSEEEKKKPSKKGKGRKKKGGSDDSDWGKTKEKTTKAKKSGGGGRGKGGGYTRSYKLSPALADLMGEDEMPRHKVVKRIWALVKEKNLYDPNNKQFTICDDALYKVFGTKRFRTFGMMKYLKAHFMED